MPMVKLSIDGREVQAQAGTLVLQAARDAGIQIPSLCWHRKLTPTGACRLCLVKIEGTRGLVTSCSTVVREGMRVTAFDEELEDTRRFILDYLLAEVRCGSDGTFRDEFDELVDHYGLSDPSRRAFPVLTSIRRPPVDASSPVLTFDPSRCILCFRCVKACAEVQGKGVLSVVERGERSVIAAGTGAWSSSECDGCGECIQLCPTGAIVEKPHRSQIDLSRTHTVRTTCPYCGVGCQIDLAIQDGRIVRADGAEEVLPNDGRLCVKGRFGYDFVHSPDRLTHPLIKENGGFREASWDEALDRAAAGLSAVKTRHGPDALAGYSSAKCTNEENYLFQKLVRVAFGTNNVDYCTRLCHASTVTGMLRAIGDGAGSNSIQDFETTDCLLVVGNNIIETHPVTATYVKRGRARGQRIIVVDPKETPLVRYADVWLQPRLGTDVALMNGMIRAVIQGGWVDRDFITRRVSRRNGGVRRARAAGGEVHPVLHGGHYRRSPGAAGKGGTHLCDLRHGHDRNRHGHEPADHGDPQRVLSHQPDADHGQDRAGALRDGSPTGSEQRPGRHGRGSLSHLSARLHPGLR